MNSRGKLARGIFRYFELIIYHAQWVSEHCFCSYRTAYLITEYRNNPESNACIKARSNYRNLPEKEVCYVC